MAIQVHPQVSTFSIIQDHPLIKTIHYSRSSSLFIVKIQDHPLFKLISHSSSTSLFKSASSCNQDHPLFKIIVIIHPQDSRSSIIQTHFPFKFNVIIQVGLIMLGSWRVGWGVQSCRMRLSPMPNGSDVRVCQDIASCTCYGLW